MSPTRLPGRVESPSPCLVHAVHRTSVEIAVELAFAPVRWQSLTTSHPESPKASAPTFERRRGRRRHGWFDGRRRSVGDGELGVTDGVGPNFGSGSSSEHPATRSTGRTERAARTARVRLTSPIIPRRARGRNGPATACGQPWEDPRVRHSLAGRAESPMQARILAQLRDEGALSKAQLADRLQVSRTTISAEVARLGRARARPGGRTGRVAGRSPLDPGRPVARHPVRRDLDRRHRHVGRSHRRTADRAGDPATGRATSGRVRRSSWQRHSSWCARCWRRSASTR